MWPLNGPWDVLKFPVNNLYVFARRPSVFLILVDSLKEAWRKKMPYYGAYKNQKQTMFFFFKDSVCIKVDWKTFYHVCERKKEC